MKLGHDIYFLCLFIIYLFILRLWQSKIEDENSFQWKRSHHESGDKRAVRQQYCSCIDDGCVVDAIRQIDRILGRENENVCGLLKFRRSMVPPGIRDYLLRSRFTRTE